MKFSLTEPIRYVKGVGPQKEKLFNTLGVYTLNDLIYYFPRDYEDRTKKKQIIELLDGERVAFDATVNGNVSIVSIRGNMKMLKTTVVDSTGSVSLTWFNAIYVKSALKPGRTYTFFGQVKRNVNKIEMINPVFEECGSDKNTGKILAIYPSTSGLTQNTIRSVMQETFNSLGDKFDEFLPESIRLNNNLVDINNALYYIHFPDDEESYIEARRRLVFDELLLLQLGLMQLKYSKDYNKVGIKFFVSDEVNKFINNLPFKLTNAQNKVVETILEDMQSTKPMNRLVQGDVGSGKTIVAAIAMFNAVKNGYQAVMMAPTGILAEQHFNSFKELFSEYNINVELLSGGMTAKQKKLAKERISSGEANIVIGTHALLEDDVVFKNLGFIVTDEQHRFGVKQRSKLTEKGENPDTLVMTATPIPRTLALILYGDLDISIIDELPPNRKPVETFLISEKLQSRLNSFVSKEIDAGRQVYVVCPLIEEDEEKIDLQDKPKLKTVMEVAEEYKKVFPNYKIEFLHGQMKQSQKDEIMLKFKNHEIDILVSTTVIEVGVNVPNATLMIIENAERFGLAALHQLRGRVGRGDEKSYCILKCYSFSDNTKERMNIMTKTNDGFKIAEKDLEIRGPGEFLGVRQHGLPEFKIANIFADNLVLEETSKVAKDIFSNRRDDINYKSLFDKVNSKFSEITL